MSEHTPVFPARLKTTEGQLLSEGYARMHPHKGELTFFSDFVPLLPLDTTVNLLRVLGESEVQGFRGQVYLSDRTLLRLVSVTEQDFPHLAEIHCENLALSARLDPILPEATGSLRPFLFRKTTVIPSSFSVLLTQLSDQTLTFLYDCNRPFSLGDRFYLTAEAQPPLPSLHIVLLDALLFGVNASYHCRIMELGAKEQPLLRQFLLRQSLDSSYSTAPLPPEE